MAKKEAAEKGEPKVVAKCDNLYEVSQNYNNLLASVTQSRICTNMLALKVKLNDLRSNMDVSRIAEPTEKDMERLERYKKEYERLMNAFQEQINKEDWSNRV